MDGTVLNVRHFSIFNNKHLIGKNRYIATKFLLNH